MAKQFTVQLKGQALKDLEEIAGLCKETPENLLARAFKEWVELREDLEDAKAADRILAETQPESWVPAEEVWRDLEKRNLRSRPGRTRARQTSK